MQILVNVCKVDYLHEYQVKLDPVSSIKYNHLDNKTLVF